MRIHLRCFGVQGLGEMMPEQLWNTTMDPSKRTLKRLTVEDAAEAAAAFSLLMGPLVKHYPHALYVVSLRLEIRRINAAP